MSDNERESPAGRKPVLVVTDMKGPESVNVIWALLAGVISVAAHVVLFILIMSIPFGGEQVNPDDLAVTDVQIEKPESEADLTNTEIGIDSTMPTNYNVDRIEDVSVPGPVDPTAAAGISSVTEVASQTVPPPPGTGLGDGSARKDDNMSGIGAMGNLPGGYGGPSLGGFTGRSGATRQKMLVEGGGNQLSEAAVARGLEWFALHQADNGSWSLDGFNKHAHEKLGPGGKTFTCNCSNRGNRNNDVAGTALAILPFLAAGQTHKPLKDKKVSHDYYKQVEAGLNFLVSKQDKEGGYVAEIYSHCLATIAMCEAVGMTGDVSKYKGSAQKAINHIVEWQDPVGGGWRYTKHAPGDVSVSGWALMALKSGQISGLSVPAASLKKMERFLDSSETGGGTSGAKGTYSYVGNNAPTPAMTAVGLLCRQYLGVTEKNPSLLSGIQFLKQPENAPGKTNNIYYEYYATQVMHHIGGETWNYWNVGPDGKGGSGIRDILVKRQDQGMGTQAHQRGSWTPQNAQFYDAEGGRILSTSLALLTLEVYYRHMPLYEVVTADGR
jgi:hypothetical protein